MLSIRYALTTFALSLSVWINTASAVVCTEGGDDGGQNFSTACGLNAAVIGGVTGEAFGAGASVPGADSMAIGYYTVASGEYAAAVGHEAEAAGWYSIAFGNLAKTTDTATSSTAIGNRAYANQPNTLVLGAIPGINGAASYVKVGMGTTNPQAPLHVARNDGSAQIYVQESNATGAARTLFKLSNKGNNKFEIEESGSGNSWAFTNSGMDFRVSLQGSGVVEFAVANNGNATLAGTLTQNSDVNAKQAIVPVDPEDILEKVAALPISQWQYKDESGVNHVGPMAQDFHAAFGLGATVTGISTLDSSGVALAAIQALAMQNRALDARNRVLESEVRELKALVLNRLPKAVQN